MPALSAALPSFRRLSATWPRHATQPYTPEEVTRLLAPTTATPDERRQAVLAIAAEPSLWLGHLTARDGGRLARRLTAIVQLHTMGASSEAILKRLGGLGTWSIRHALHIASSCIARRLNERQAMLCEADAA